MTGLVEDLRAAGAVVRRDWRITVSYRTRFLTQILSVFFTLTMLHFFSRLVHVSSFKTPEAYFAFALIGLITLQILNSTLYSPPGTLRQELVAGTFERFVLSPMGGVRGSLALMLFPFMYAVATGIVMLALAAPLYGVHLHWATLPLIVPVGLLGALSFAPFGVLFLAVVLLVKQAISGAAFIIAGISLIAGLYFPISLLPAWLRTLSELQPFTPAVDLMRHVMVGTPLHQGLATELAKMVGFTAVLLPLSAVALSVALRVSRRRGTILEY
jgi:ABC-2 type transport system permease protein